MVQNTTKEYNLTDTHTKKLMRENIAHEYCKKTNVVGKKYKGKHGWKKEEDQEQFVIQDGPSFPRLLQ